MIALVACLSVAVAAARRGQPPGSILAVGGGLIAAAAVAGAVLGAGRWSALGAVTSGYLGAAGAAGAATLVVAVAFVARGARGGPTAPPSSESWPAQVSKRFRAHRLAVASAVLLAVLIELALLAGVLEAWLGVSHDDATNIRNRYQGSSWPHLLGTDDLGRDVFTRLLFGGQISLAVGLVSALSSALLGSLVGLLAGFYGGGIDRALMRFTDAMLGVPILPLMIVFSALDLEKLLGGGVEPSTVGALVAAVVVLALLGRRQGSRLPPGGVLLLGGALLAGYLGLFGLIDWSELGSGNLASVVKIILIITFFGWMTVARLARAAALTLKEQEFVTAARALGASDARIILLHVAPGALAPIIVAATLEVGGNILWEAALSFLGLGIQPPVPSWGNMLNNALEYVKSEPLLAFWPGMLTLVTVTCFNFFGDGMRDALDPHQVLKGKT